MAVVLTEVAASRDPSDGAWMFVRAGIAITCVGVLVALRSKSLAPLAIDFCIGMSLLVFAGLVVRAPQAILLLVIGIGFSLGFGMSFDGGGALLLLALGGIALAAHAIWGLRRLRASGPASAAGAWVLIAGFAWPLVIAAPVGVSHARHYTGSREQYSAYDAQEARLAMMVRAECAIRVHRATGEWPESLTRAAAASCPLLRTNCPQCTKMPQPDSQHVGAWHVRYEPVLADGNPRPVVAFRVRGWDAAQDSTRAHLFIDTTGQLFRATSARDTNGIEETRIPEMLASLHACVVKAGPGVHFGGGPDRADPLRCTSGSFRSTNGDTAYTERDYRIVLERDSTTTPGTTHFRLRARPRAYGQSGIRSYIVDENGLLYSTMDPDSTQA
jgi:hypothetical protein